MLTADKNYLNAKSACLQGVEYLHLRAMFPIFEKLGGQEEALKLLQPAAIRDTWPSRHTLKSWEQRHRELPALVVRKLMDICDERGIAYTSDDFKYAPSYEPRQTADAAG